jgi:hypothetical protein
VRAQEQQRFARGLRFSQPVPFTLGLRAFSLAGLLPNLQVLSLDERTSCIGGMTDDFAAALARACPRCGRAGLGAGAASAGGRRRRPPPSRLLPSRPARARAAPNRPPARRRLRVLEVMFSKYSVPSELFTDAGMIKLSEGCPQLEELLLKNTFLSDRSIYALAANCRGLRRLKVSGYSEQMGDGGLTVLAETCGELRCARARPRLPLPLPLLLRHPTAPPAPAPC